MSEIRESLLTNLSILTEKITNFKDIIRRLLSKKVISVEESEDIDLRSNSNASKIEALCLLIRRKSFEQMQEFVEILEETGNKEAVVILRKSYQHFQVLTAKQQMWIDVAAPSPKFYGREEELNLIENLLQSNESSGKQRLHRLVVLSGLGGLGKTQIARKFSRIYYKIKKGSVVWIPAQSSLTLNNAFVKLAEKELKLKIRDENGQQISIDSIVDLVFQFFSSTTSLFIFDNAEEYKETKSDKLKALYDFLPLKFTYPPDFNTPYALITTRCSQLIPYAHEICLNCFSPNESHDFVGKNLNFTPNENDLKNLCSLLQYFPHALQQAISYINQQHKVKQDYNIQKYISAYQSKAKDLLAHQVDFLSEHEYGLTTLITWNITLNKVKEDKRDGQLATSILNYIAYLSPDNIERKLICKLLKKKEDDDEVDGAIKLPSDYSMYTLNSGVISVHRLVQQVVRIGLNGEGAEEEIITSMLLTFYKILTASTSKIGPNTLGHFWTTWSHASVYPNIVDQFCAFPLKIAMKYRFHSMLSESLSIASEGYDLFKKRSLDNIGNVTRLLLRQFIGDTYTELGDYRKAADILEATLTDARTLIPNEKSFLIMVMHNLARVYGTNKLDIPEKSKEYHENIMTIKNLLSKEENDRDISFTKTKNNQATQLVAEGRFPEALRIFEEIYAVQLAAFPADNPDVTTTRNNIAEVLRHLGKYREADKLHCENMGLQSSTLSQEHTSRISTENNRALIYLQQGETDKALEIFERSFAIQKNKFGVKHPETLKTYQNIAECHKAKGNFAEALKIHEEVLTLLKEQYGVQHSLTLHAKNYIGIVHLESEKPHLALQIFKENYSIQNEMGKANPETCKTRNNIAESYSRMGNHDRANRVHEDNYKIQVTAFGLEHPDVIISRNNLAKSYKEIGNFGRAIQLYEENLKCETQLLGAENLALCKTRHNLCAVFIKLEKWQDALSLQKQNYEIRRGKLGDGDPLTIQSKSNIEFIQTNMGTYTVKTLENEYLISKITLGEDHPQTVAIKQKIDGRHNTS